VYPARGRALGIAVGARRVVVAVVPVRAPLPDVAPHVEQAVGTRPIRARAHSPGGFVSPGPTEDGAFGGRLLVSPRIFSAVGPARSLLPLRLRRQASPGPFAVRPRLFPGDVDHRVVVANSPVRLVRWKRGAGGFGELLELAPGHARLVHQEFRYVDDVFERGPLGLFVSHRKFSSGDLHHHRAIDFSPVLFVTLRILAEVGEAVGSRALRRVGGVEVDQDRPVRDHLDDLPHFAPRSIASANLARTYPHIPKRRRGCG
jgi:hypothetical protein